MFKKSVSLIMALFLIAGLTTAAVAAPRYQVEQTIVDIAVEDGRFTTLVTALQAAELVETLQGEGPFTVFAPTDEAFAALPEGTLDSLLADIPTLTDVLLYHVVPGQVMAADVVSLEAADTVQGQPIAISVMDGAVMVNGANVITTDIVGSNGVIHVIDAVILPPSDEDAMMTDDATMADDAAMADDSAMSQSSMTDGCSEDYVVQADDWLSTIAEKFYGDVTAYTIIAEATNATAAAGGAYDPIANVNIIEVGQVLCIPTTMGSDDTAMVDDNAAAADDTMMAAGTIVDVAVADGRFTTLVTALQAAELVETLQGEGPFTVFAPTDEAFAALPEGTLDTLLADIPALTDVLLYHVVAGAVPAADVVTLNSADTVQGSALVISTTGDTVMVGDAQVIIPDIQASNGIIHVIDTVLIPAPASE